MHKIIFSHFFIYFNEKGEVIRKVLCTSKEKLSSAKSVLRDFRAYRVIKIKNNIN